MTSPGTHSNPINLNMICHVLLLSITFMPNFMIVVCSYLEIWPRAILVLILKEKSKFSERSEGFGWYLKFFHSELWG